MKPRLVSHLVILVLLFLCRDQVMAQPSFVERQLSQGKIAEIFYHRQDSLKKEFEAKQFNWPPRNLYIRSFKHNQLMEIWIRDEDNRPYRLFKTYPICELSGKMGPKRKEGDLQIPEGFYYINEFNPNSNYHLSMGLNYPNVSDQLLSDSLQPGGEIYIHGDCITVGCLPITDIPIEELYIMATYATNAGQDFIPVHIFPINYSDAQSMEYLAFATKKNQPLQRFAVNLKEVFDYFEENRQLPVIMVNTKGEYILD